MPKIFTRTDSATVQTSIQLFKDEARHDRKRLIAASLLIPLAHLSYVVLLPLFVSLIIQSLITHPHDTAPLIFLILGMVIVSGLALVSNKQGFVRLFHHEEHITTRLTKRAMDNLMSQSYEFFSNHKVGSLTTDVIGFSRAYMVILDSIFLQASSIFVSFIASLIIIGIMSPILLLPLGLLTIGIVLHSAFSLSRRSRLRNKRKELLSKLYGTIADVLGNQILVRVFAQEKNEVNSLNSSRIAIEKIMHQEITMIENGSVERQIILYAFQIATIIVCIILFAQGGIAIAALIFIVSYLARVTHSLFSISGIIRTVEQAFLDAAPMTKILQQSIDIKNVPHAKDIRIERGQIELEDITFSYSDEGAQTVFENLSLSVKPGERVGLAGRSGGGKSTFTKLLLRFVDIQSGHIFIDDQDIALVSQESLRSQIAYVPQEPFLFHRSLRDNIAYGAPDATDEAIRQAAKQANALDFIDALPHGFDTVVGERGVKLSGGQRQRVAIARAILKDAPILILDEATSSLDSESEQLIQDALTKLMKGRTSIVIAHRLSTIANLDRIVVLDHGEIVENGTHTELLALGGTYAMLWSHQSGGFIQD